VAKFSTLSGERLTSIYKKLKEEDLQDRKGLSAELNSNGSGRDADSGGGFYQDDGSSSRRMQKPMDVGTSWDADGGHSETWKRGMRANSSFSEDILSQGNVYRRRDAQLGGRIQGGYMQEIGTRGQDFREALPGSGNWGPNERNPKWGGDEWGPNFADGYDRRGNEWNRRMVSQFGYPFHGQAEFGAPPRPGLPMGFYPLNPVSAHLFPNETERHR
jgi:hypothetical protein